MCEWLWKKCFQTNSWLLHCRKAWASMDYKEHDDKFISTFEYTHTQHLVLDYNSLNWYSFCQKVYLIYIVCCISFLVVLLVLYSMTTSTTLLTGGLSECNGDLLPPGWCVNNLSYKTELNTGAVFSVLCAICSVKCALCII